MAKQLFTNNASAALASGISDSALSLSVAAGLGSLFPTITGSDFFEITVSSVDGTTMEVMTVTARSGDDMTVTRAQEGTSAAAFSAGAIVRLTLTAAGLNSFVQEGEAAGGDLDGTYKNPTIKASVALSGNPTATTQSAGDNSTRIATTAYADNAVAKQPEAFTVAVSDETTAITTGDAQLTFRMPFAMTLTSVRASLTTESSSGNPTIDINESGSTIFSTKLSIDSGERTSTTAATPAVISDASLADDAEITVDIDTAGTGATGLKLTFIGTRT